MRIAPMKPLCFRCTVAAAEREEALLVLLGEYTVILKARSCNSLLINFSIETKEKSTRAVPKTDKFKNKKKIYTKSIAPIW